MITNIQKVFVMFVTLCFADILMSTTVLASSEPRFMGSTSIVKKHRHDSKIASSDSEERNKERSHNKNQTRHEEKSTNSKHANQWHPWKNRNDQKAAKQHNLKHKQDNNHREHDDWNSNQFDNRKQKKQKNHNLTQQHRNQNSFSPHYNNPDHFDHRRESINYDKHREHRGSSNHRKYSKNRVIKHSHNYRPKYNLYKRHKHVYYRTPWYNTHFVAPIHYHYHPIGHRVRHLPKLHVRIFVGGLPYFYMGGVFYQSIAGSYVVVGAPIGAIVQTLPVGFITFSIGPVTYYHVNDTYFIWDEPHQAYAVVNKPDGADDAIAETTTGRLFVYPNQGQSEEQQAKDRYECHRWAVVESRVDPTIEDAKLTPEDRKLYQRAIGACLEGRNYTVK